MQEEDNTTKKSSLSLSEEDFERIRCNKCNGYLNCPPIMAYLEKDPDYTECGRCFNEETANSEGLHPVRNRALELLANLTPFPCKNFVNGCTERRTWPQIETHEKECFHRTFTCPQSLLKRCQYQGVMQDLLQHFLKEHSELLINDGKLKETFDKDFENCYLVHQNANLLALQVKCDVHLKKVWFISYLLEEGDPIECNLEFSNESCNISFIVKLIAIFQPLTILDTSKALETNLNAIRNLLTETESITSCSISLTTKFSSLHLTELLKEIQCPACWEFMRGKIFMCKNGHNVCSKCKEFVKHCPSCRDDVLDVRNLSLEKLIMHGLFPCKYNSAGCTYVGILEEMLYHTKYCYFNL